MRTLGFAYKIMNDDELPFSEGAIAGRDLVFMGIAAISDPVRAEVPDAVKECIDAGIAIKIVTGDTPNTAKEIARQISLWNENQHHLRLMNIVRIQFPGLLSHKAPIYP